MQRAGLALASVPYRAAVALRNAAFDVGLLCTRRADAPVISVGNVTAGGTGKTPMVAWIVRRLQERGARPAILSRGYRSLDGEANDEKLVLDQLCPGVPHVQNRDRVAGARTVIVEHQADVIVLDDGFQHRRLGRDLDVVLIDALNPWGYGHLLPRGLLREPLTALRRSGLIVLTRADLVSSEERQRIAKRIRETGTSAPLVEVAFAPEQFINASGQTLALDALSGQSVLAFCGIGNPGGFRRVVERCGLQTAAVESFPDHHHYNAGDLTKIAAAARASNSAVAVTTEKDLVKIPAPEIEGIPVWAIRIAAQVMSNESVLCDRLQEVLNFRPQQRQRH